MSETQSEARPESIVTKALKMLSNAVNALLAFIRNSPLTSAGLALLAVLFLV